MLSKTHKNAPMKNLTRLFAAEQHQRWLIDKIWLQRKIFNVNHDETFRYPPCCSNQISHMAGSIEFSGSGRPSMQFLERKIIKRKK